MNATVAWLAHSALVINFAKLARMDFLSRSRGIFVICLSCKMNGRRDERWSHVANDLDGNLLI